MCSSDLLGLAARAARLDRACRSVFNEGFGDLRAGAVAGAQKQQSRSSPPRLESVWLRRREREPGVEREPRFAEKVLTAEQIGPVVDVATVSRASAGADDVGLSELRQVVGDQVLRLAHELHELANTPIAATEFADQLPTQRIAEQSENLRRLCFSHGR